MAMTATVCFMLFPSVPAAKKTPSLSDRMDGTAAFYSAAAPGGCVFVGAFVFQTVFSANSRAADVDDLFLRVDAAPAHS